MHMNGDKKNENQVDVKEIIQEIQLRIVQEKIVEEIKNEIKQKGLVEDAVKFETVSIPVKLPNQSYNHEELLSNLDTLNHCYHIEPYRMLHSNRPIVGRIITFVKKVIRKSMKFYIEPIAQDQSMFNASVVRCMNQIYKYIENNQGNMQATSAQEMCDIQKKMELIRQENKMLRQENEWLKTLVEFNVKKMEEV